MYSLVLLREPVAQGGVQASTVVDLLGEVGEAVDRVLRGPVVVPVDLFVFQSLDEALDGRVIVPAAGSATLNPGARHPPGARGSGGRRRQAQRLGPRREVDAPIRESGLRGRLGR